jgi:hypothetical protein
MEYVLWSTDPIPNGCILDSPENVEFTPRLTRGVPYAKDFPRNACMRMSSEAKKRIRLYDDVVNSDRIKVCSARLVAFLKDRKLRGVEYLPISILDHKGKVASRDYFIVHPLGLEDALDAKRSNPTWSAIAKTEIMYVQSLVIDPSKVDPKARVFRLKSFLDPVLIEKTLADEIAAAGFEGPLFQPLEEWDR